jgi:hypothetical protein
LEISSPAPAAAPSPAALEASAINEKNVSHKRCKNTLREPARATKHENRTCDGTQDSTAKKQRATLAETLLKSSETQAAKT